ncbi:NADH dehydrogenase [ubiquinone] 1 beta subcomplex subunit 1 [Xylocopa sonorina]|uniref:NADH dehydrogenase [ubiquinone] 1 beta subcomplex subunit 1 n=1 Tax=Xylocopa sonorina TaxID=1818115 RepID=UPI00403AD534
MEAIRRYYRECPARYITHVQTIKFVICMYIARKLYYVYSDRALTSFRDKSALFGKELEPGERPSWP